MADGKVTALAVTLRLTADADGETRLRLPSDWGGGEKLWRFVRDLTVAGGEVSAPDEATRVVKSKPNADLTVRYRVVSAYDGEPPVDSPNFGQPIIGPDGFYVVGSTIFVTPEDRDGDRARFTWDPAGSGLTFVSDLERLQKQPGRMQDISASVAFAARDLTVLERTVAGAPLRVAVRGKHAFDADAFVDMIARVIGAERGFWGEPGQPFLVTLAPQTPIPNNTSRRGTGLDDAFALIATTNTPLDDFRLFVAHEYFHSWNSERLGGSKEGPDEPLGYWFSEGFTDYYARKLALRSGLVDLEAFATAWSDALATYGTSPVRNVSNAEIAARFWGDRDMHKLPYARGALFAVLVEQALRPAGGLDPVMLAMRDHVDAHPDRRDWDYAAANLFPRIAKARTGVDLTAQIERYVVKGETIVLPPDAFGGCLTVETIVRKVFVRGFDGEASLKAGAIVGVDPAGAAYAAGLRDGMKRLGREGGDEADGAVEIGYRVADDKGVERVIRYQPQGQASYSVQKVAAPKDLTPEARKACVKAVAG